jgi:spermidine synthase
MSSIEISEERGLRYLHFGSHWVQGAMRIARPWALELEYTRELMMPLLLRPEPGWPASVLQIGLGAASVTRFLHRHRPEAKITVIEILPQVVAAARQFFKLPDDPQRLRVQIGDGHDYMATTKRRRFDLIVVDGFDDQGRAGMLESVPFYLNCRERLTARGMMSINLLGRRLGVKGAAERLREAFGDALLVMPPSDAGNTVALATSGRAVRDGDADLHAQALALKSQTGLDLRPTLLRLADRG